MLLPETRGHWRESIFLGRLQAPVDSASEPGPGSQMFTHQLPSAPVQGHSTLLGAPMWHVGPVQEKTSGTETSVHIEFTFPVAVGGESLGQSTGSNRRTRHARVGFDLGLAQIPCPQIQNQGMKAVTGLHVQGCVESKSKDEMQVH